MLPCYVHNMLTEHLARGAEGRRGRGKTRRQAIHMTTYAMRRKKCDVVIHIDIEAAISDYIPFYRSQKGVILTEGTRGILPCTYFLKVVNIIIGQEIDDSMQHTALFASAGLPLMLDDNVLGEYMRDWIDDTRDAPRVSLNHGIINNFIADNAAIVYISTGIINSVNKKQDHQLYSLHNNQSLSYSLGSPVICNMVILAETTRRYALRMPKTDLMLRCRWKSSGIYATKSPLQYAELPRPIKYRVAEC